MAVGGGMLPLPAAMSTVSSRRTAPRLDQEYEEGRAQLLQRFCGHTWAVWGAGPMWSCELGETGLRRLAGQLQAAVNAVQRHSGLRVRAQLLPGLADPVLALEVTRPDGESMIAELLLVGDEQAGRSVPDTPSLRPWSWFPLLLTRGDRELTEAIVMALRSSYGAAVRNPGFTQQQMGWMVAIWAALSRADAATGLTVKYRLPEAVAAAGLSTLTLELPAADVQRVSAATFGTQRAQVSLDQMSTFHTVLSEIVQLSVGVPVFQLDLADVKTDLASFTDRGTVRFSANRSVEVCLPLLQELLREVFGA